MDITQQRDVVIVLRKIMEEYSNSAGLLPHIQRLFADYKRIGHQMFLSMLKPLLEPLGFEFSGNSAVWKAVPQRDQVLAMLCCVLAGIM